LITQILHHGPLFYLPQFVNQKVQNSN
jgi:hypothetical protein